MIEKEAYDGDMICSKSIKTQPSPSGCLELLLTCRQIYNEAESLLLRGVTFVAPKGYGPMRESFECRSSEAGTSITSVTLTIGKTEFFILENLSQKAQDKMRKGHSWNEAYTYIAEHLPNVTDLRLNITENALNKEEKSDLVSLS